MRRIWPAIRTSWISRIWWDRSARCPDRVSGRTRTRTTGTGAGARPSRRYRWKTTSRGRCDIFLASGRTSLPSPTSPAELSTFRWWRGAGGRLSTPSSSTWQPSWPDQAVIIQHKPSRQRHTNVTKNDVKLTTVSTTLERHSVGTRPSSNFLSFRGMSRHEKSTKIK